MKFINARLGFFVALGSILTSVHAAILPVAENTTSTATGKINKTTGTAGTLTVTAKQQSFLIFDLSALPATVTASNITSARLTLYVSTVTAATAGNLSLHLVTSPWEELPSVAVDEPAFSSNVLATISASDLVAKSFVSVDVTAAVTNWFNGGTNFGIAITGVSGTVTLGSKEAVGSGFPALLEIETSPDTSVLNVSQLTNGVLPLTSLPAVVVTNGETGVTLGGAFSGDGSGLTNLTVASLNGGTNTNAFILSNTNNVFVGNGAGLTNLPAVTNLTAAALTGGTNTNAFTFSNTNNVFVGNGAGLTNLNPTNLTAGTAAISISGNAATATTATSFTGSLAGNVTGTQSATVISTLPAISGASLTSLTAANISAGTAPISITGNAATATVANNVAGGISITNATTISGNGGGLTNLTATNLVGQLSATNATNFMLLSGATGASETNRNTNTFSGPMTNTASQYFTGTNGPNGNGANLTNLTAANIAAGTAGISISGNAGTATSATSATVADNVVSGINITNATISGNGSGLTNLPSWSLTGNAGTTPGTQFLGTTDTNILELHVNNTRAFALDGSHDSDQPNIIGGSYNNYVNPGTYGATISGGHENTINITSGHSEHSAIGGGNSDSILDSHDATIAGGGQNTIESNSPDSTISGGYGNLISNVQYAVIAGGNDNVIGAYDQGSAIGGGINNYIGYNAYSTVIGGGYWNSISNVYYAVIAGGEYNLIGDNDTASAIGGGYYNYIGESSEYSTISGGYTNDIGQSAYASVIGGGAENTITNFLEYATIPGGFSNLATANYTFAAGQQAQATNQGAFVWADSQNAVFASTNNDSFNVRARGGINFVTSGAGITLDGQPMVTNNSTGVTLSGTFSATNVGGFTGDGSALTNLNAADLSGTDTNTVTFSSTNNVFVGNGSSISNLNAAYLSGTDTNAVSFSNTNDVFVGNGSGLTNITDLESGISITNAYLTNAIITNSVFVGNTVGAFSGDGSALTDLQTTNLTYYDLQTNCVTTAGSTLTEDETLYTNIWGHAATVYWQAAVTSAVEYQSYIYIYNPGASTYAYSLPFSFGKAVASGATNTITFRLLPGQSFVETNALGTGAPVTNIVQLE